MTPVQVCVQPNPDSTLIDAVVGAGARLAPLDEADALVWTTSAIDAFPRPLPERIGWVQLPAAGVENWLASGLVDTNRLWTSAAGAYSATVAEHALALLMAGVRGIAASARQTSWRRGEMLDLTGTLRGATVTVLGAGGIGRALTPMLTAFGARVIAVNRSGRPVDGADATVAVAELATVWPQTDHVVVAAPATPQTRHIIGSAELAQLKPSSWLVNVARGSLVDTDALVAALRAGTIAGAALDVTDPEPLPDGHPLWTEPRSLITPHSANPIPLLKRAFAQRVAENVTRWMAGAEPLGRIDAGSGY
jgi:phosphoglycerate dehydrogenase-like enzyme